MNLKCVMCKSDLHESDVNHIIDFDGHIVIIKNVPAKICRQCGEYFLNNNTARVIEKITETVINNHAEIFVVDMAA